MTAIGWLLIMVGIGAIIDGYHGHTIWSSINTWLLGSGKAQTAAKKAGS